MPSTEHIFGLCSPMSDDARRTLTFPTSSPTYSRSHGNVSKACRMHPAICPGFMGWHAEFYPTTASAAGAGAN
jgi:hypothetical protein